MGNKSCKDGHGEVTKFWFIIDKVDKNNIPTANDLQKAVVELLNLSNRALPGFSAQVVGATLEKDEQHNIVQGTVYLKDYTSAKQASAIINSTRLGGCVVSTNCVILPGQDGTYQNVDIREQQRQIRESRLLKLRQETQGRLRLAKERVIKKQQELLRKELEKQELLQKEQEKQELLKKEQEKQELLKKEQELLKKEQELIKMEQEEKLREEQHEQELLELEKKHELIKEQLKQELREKERKQVILEQQIRNEVEQNYEEKLQELKRKKLLEQEFEERLVEPRQDNVEQEKQENKKKQENKNPQENQEKPEEIHVRSNGRKANNSTTKKNHKKGGKTDLGTKQDKRIPNVCQNFESVPSCSKQEILERNAGTCNTVEDTCGMHEELPTNQEDKTIGYVFKFPNPKGDTYSGELSPEQLPNDHNMVNDRVSNWLAAQTSDPSDSNSSVKSDETVSSVGSSLAKEQTWVFVSSLPNHINGKELYECFKSKCQGVKRARKSKDMKGCAEVSFKTQKQMQMCVAKMDNSTMFGQKIRVRPKPLAINQNEGPEKLEHDKQPPQSQEQQHYKQRHKQQQQQQQHGQPFGHHYAQRPCGQEFMQYGQQTRGQPFGNHQQQRYRHPFGYQLQQQPREQPFGYQPQPFGNQQQQPRGQLFENQQQPRGQPFGNHQQQPRGQPFGNQQQPRGQPFGNQQQPRGQPFPQYYGQQPRGEELRQHQLQESQRQQHSRPRQQLHQELLSQQNPQLQHQPPLQSQILPQLMSQLKPHQQPPSQKKKRRRRRGKKSTQAPCRDDTTTLSENNETNIQPTVDLEDDTGNVSSGSSLSENAETYLGNHNICSVEITMGVSKSPDV